MKQISFFDEIKILNFKEIEMAIKKYNLNDFLFIFIYNFANDLKGSKSQVNKVIDFLVYHMCFIEIEEGIKIEKVNAIKLLNKYITKYNSCYEENIKLVE